MSSLPLLDEVTKGDIGSSSKTDMTTLLCSPALLVLIVGGGLIIHNITMGNTKNIGQQMFGTILFTFVVGTLCLVGLTSVSWAIVTLPIVIVLSLVIIVILTLMLTSPGKKRVHPKKVPRHQRIHPKEPTMSEAYKYVMTGKGFGGMRY